VNVAGTFIVAAGAHRTSASPSLEAMGAKAFQLARMAELGLPVPPAFVLGTRHCAPCLAAGGVTAELRGALPALLAALEPRTGLRFGDARRPLLVSVRSGAPVTMPGMMQTLLNIGLTERTLPGFEKITGNPRLVHDAYRRLVAQFGEVVAGIPPEAFDAARTGVAGAQDERTLDFAQLRALAQRYLDVYREGAGARFPQDPAEQLTRAIAAVFRSWQAPHAHAYREANGIAHDLGTAVIVQAMVFGNAGGRSGAGVGFTRDPTTGAPGLWIDYLPNAQGEDVVSGRRVAHGAADLARTMPAVWQELVDDAARLEAAFADMQDIEFTVQDGHLHLLQARAGKRSPLAALRIALDLADEGVIDAAIARERTRKLAVERIVTTRVAGGDGATVAPLGHGASANAGVATGEIALDETRAKLRAAAGAALVLVRRDAETADLAALELAHGLLTARGARTSHAAVVARQLGKACIVGCATLSIDFAARSVRFGDRTLAEGDLVTLDGNTGAIYAGAVRTVEERPVDLLSRLAKLPGASSAQVAEPALD
jgi:pyruvate,orthophosphate dikinase